MPRLISDKQPCVIYFNGTPALLTYTVDDTDILFDGNFRCHIQTNQESILEMKIVRIDIPVTEGCHIDFLKVIEI